VNGRGVRPREKTNVGPTDVRTLRQVLHDVALLTMAAHATIPQDELMAAFQRVQEWYIRLDVRAVITMPDDAANVDRDGSDSPSQRGEP